MIAASNSGLRGRCRAGEVLDFAGYRAGAARTVREYPCALGSVTFLASFAAPIGHELKDVPHRRCWAAFPSRVENVCRGVLDEVSRSGCSTRRG